MKSKFFCISPASIGEINKDLVLYLFSICWRSLEWVKIHFAKGQLPPCIKSVEGPLHQHLSLFENLPDILSEKTRSFLIFII